MRTFIALLVSFTMAFGVPLQVAASGPIYVEDGPISDILAALPSGEAHAAEGGISYDAPASNPLNGEITAASFPYTDDLGRSFMFHATFTPNSVFWIEGVDFGSPNAGYLGSGILSADQAYILKKAAEERRRVHKGEGRWLQPVWLLPAIEIVLALGGIALAVYYETRDSGGGGDMGDINARLDAMCANDVTRDTAHAWQRASNECPARGWTTPDGKICRNAPDVRNASQSEMQMCQGSSYHGCTQECT